MKRILIYFFLLISLSSFSQNEIWGSTSYGGKSNGGVLFNVDSETQKINIQHRFRSDEQSSNGAGMAYIDSLECFIGYSGDHLFKYKLSSGQLTQKTVSRNIFGNIYFDKYNNKCHAFGEYSGYYGPVLSLLSIDPLNLDHEFNGISAYLEESANMQFTPLGDSLLMFGYQGGISMFDLKRDTLYRAFEIEDNILYDGIGELLAYNGRYYGMISKLDYGNYSALYIYSFHPAEGDFVVEAEIKSSNLDQDYLRTWLAGFVKAENNKMYGAGKIVPDDERYYMFSYDPNTSVFDTLDPFPSNYNQSLFGSFILADNGKIYGTIRSEEPGVSCIFSYTTSTDQLSFINVFDSTANVEPVGNLTKGPNDKLYGLQSVVRDGLIRQIFSFDPQSETIQIEKEILNQELSSDGYYPDDFVQMDDGSIIGYTMFHQKLYKFKPQTGDFSILMDLSKNDSKNSNKSNVFKLDEDRILLSTSHYYDFTDMIININELKIESVFNYSGRFSWIEESNHSLIRHNSETHKMERFLFDTKEFEEIYSYADSISYSNFNWQDDYLFNCQKKVIYSNPDIADSISIVQFNTQTLEENFLLNLNDYCETENCKRFNFFFKSLDNNTFIGDISEWSSGPSYIHRVVQVNQESGIKNLLSYYASSSPKYSIHIDEQSGIAYAMSEVDRSHSTAGKLYQLDFDQDTMIILDEIENQSYRRVGDWGGSTRILKQFPMKFEMSYWDGEKDSSWYEPLNWKSNRLPTETAIVHINDNRPYFPVIDTFVKCRSLMIGTYANLSILPQGSLTVDALFTNKGNLNLYGDEEDRASFICNAEHQQLGHQQYIFKSDSIIDHVLSNPMVDSKRNESAQLQILEFLDVENTWEETIFYPITEDWFKPYWYHSSDSILNFVGAFSLSDSQFSADHQNNSLYPISNPYPSYLDLRNLNSSHLKHQALYLFNQETGNFTSFIDGIGNAKSLMRPLESFWFYLEYNEYLDFTFDQRIHQFQYEEDSLQQKDFLSLNLAYKEGTDQTYISFNEEATDGFDGAYDALKLHLSEYANPEIFTKASGKNISINQLPDTAMMDLFVSSGKEGNYTISIDKNKGFHYLVLEDLIWKKRVNLLEEDYSFDYFISDGNYPFKLYFNKWGLEPVTEEDVHIYYYPESIVVRSNKQIETAQIVFYDLSGRVALELQVHDFHYYEEAIQLPVGHYIVQLRTGDLVMNKKVLVRK